MQQQALADGRLQDRTSSKQAGWLRQQMSKYEELAASGFEMLHQLRQRGVDAILRDQLGLPIAKTRTRRFHGTHKLLVGSNTVLSSWTEARHRTRLARIGRGHGSMQRSSVGDANVGLVGTPTSCSFSP
jgi:hypothetical protein